MVCNRGVNDKVDQLYKRWNSLNHTYKWRSKNDSRTDALRKKLTILNKDVKKTIPAYPRTIITKMMNDVKNNTTTVFKSQPEGIAMTSAELDGLTVYRFNRGILLAHDNKEKLTNLIYSMPNIEFEYLKFNSTISGYMCSQANGYELYKRGICPLDYSDKALGIVNPFPDTIAKPITKHVNNVILGKEFNNEKDLRVLRRYKREQKKILLDLKKGRYELVHNVDNDKLREQLVFTNGIYYHKLTKIAYKTWESDKAEKSSCFFEIGGEKGALGKKLLENGDKYKYTFVEMVLLFDDDVGETHINTIIIDHEKKHIFRFEPHGGHTDSYSMTVCDNRFVSFFDRYLKMTIGIENALYTYIPPIKSFPEEGPQLKSDVSGFELKIYSDDDGNMKVEDDGYCFIWNVLFLWLNSILDLHPLVVFQVMDEQNDLDCAVKIREHSSYIVDTLVN
jgi:hypothetical protein